MMEEEYNNINIPYGFTQTSIPLQRNKRSLVPTEFANYPERFVRARQGSYEYNNNNNVPVVPIQRNKRALSQTAASSNSPRFQRPRQGSYEYKVQQLEEEMQNIEPFLTEPIRPVPYQFLEENLPSWANEYQPPPAPVRRALPGRGQSLLGTLARGKRRLRNNSPEQILATRSRRNNERPITLTNNPMATDQQELEEELEQELEEEEAANNLNLQQLTLQNTPLNPPISPQVINNILQSLNQQIYSIIQNLYRLYQINAGQVQPQSPTELEQLVRVISQQLARLRRNDILSGRGGIAFSRIPQIERQAQYILQVLEQAYTQSNEPEAWTMNLRNLQSLQPVAAPVNMLR